nr:unnamed protein product [Callosobruchus analis]
MSYTHPPKKEKGMIVVAKRALSIYHEAADIETPLKQRATLLHFGGSGIEDIYYNLPGVKADHSEDIDVFEIALQKLDEYFLPKQSRVYERRILRLIKQQKKDKFGKFPVRLRNQADKCKFDNPEEHVIDQITKKYSRVELRKKILTVGGYITLEKIIMEANTLVASARRVWKTNKLSSNYNPTPHTVEARGDGDVILKNDETGRRCRRSIIHLKRIEGQWKPVNQEENQEQGQEDDMQE